MDTVLSTRKLDKTRSDWRGHSALLAAFVALALTGLLAGCSTDPPQAVLNVPGNHVANLWATPEPLNQSQASVLMCLDEPSAVHLETGDGGQGSVGYIELRWSDATHIAEDGGNPVTLTTPVIQPGCGLLVFGVDCCHVDNYLAIKATKV